MYFSQCPSYIFFYGALILFQVLQFLKDTCKGVIFHFVLNFCYKLCNFTNCLGIFSQILLILQLIGR